MTFRMVLVVACAVLPILPESQPSKDQWSSSIAGVETADLGPANAPAAFDSLMQARFGANYQDRYRFAVGESDSIHGVFRAMHEDGFDVSLTVTDSLPPFFSFLSRNDVRIDDDSDLKAVSVAWRAGLAKGLELWWVIRRDGTPATWFVRNTEDRDEVGSRGKSMQIDPEAGTVLKVTSYTLSL